MWVIFLGFIAILILSGLSFVLMPALSDKRALSRRDKIFLGCVFIFILLFSLIWYGKAGKGHHILYEKEDARLQEIAILLEDTVPLPETVKTKIANELKAQENRAGAQPTVWLLQAQLAMQQQDYLQAKKAYCEAYQAYSDEMDLAVNCAQSWYLADNQTVSPELSAFLQDLEKRDPDQAALNNLLAVMAFHQKEYQKAIDYWNQLLWDSPQDSSEAMLIRAAIASAKTELSKEKTLKSHEK